MRGSEGTDHPPSMEVSVRIRPPHRRGVPHCVFAVNAKDTTSPVGSVAVCSKDFTNDSHTQYSFCFDRVFSPMSSTYLVYQHSVRPLVHTAISGRYSCVFLHGQEGSGKHFTLFGTRQVGDHRNTVGLVSLALRDILRNRSWGRCAVELSFVKVHGDTMSDLLSLSKDKVIGPGCAPKRIAVESADHLRVLPQQISEQRRNKTHSVLTLHTKPAGGHVGNGMAEGRLHFVLFTPDPDHKDRSFHAFTQLMYHLAMGKKESRHFPYRNSRLTYYLRHALTPESPSLFLHCMATTPVDYYASLNSIKAADRLRCTAFPITSGDVATEEPMPLHGTVNVPSEDSDDLDAFQLLVDDLPDEPVSHISLYPPSGPPHYADFTHSDIRHDDLSRSRADRDLSTLTAARVSPRPPSRVDTISGAVAGLTAALASLPSTPVSRTASPPSYADPTVAPPHHNPSPPPPHQHPSPPPPHLTPRSTPLRPPDPPSHRKPEPPPPPEPDGDTQTGTWDSLKKDIQVLSSTLEYISSRRTSPAKADAEPATRYMVGTPLEGRALPLMRSTEGVVSPSLTPGGRALDVLLHEQAAEVARLLGCPPHVSPPREETPTKACGEDGRSTEPSDLALRLQALRGEGHGLRAIVELDKENRENEAEFLRREVNRLEALLAGSQQEHKASQEAARRTCAELQERAAAVEGEAGLLREKVNLVEAYLRLILEKAQTLSEKAKNTAVEEGTVELCQNLSEVADVLRSK